MSEEFGELDRGQEEPDARPGEREAGEERYGRGFYIFS